MAFSDVIHRVRLDVFETAARAGIDVIFTKNLLWAVPDGRALFEDFTRQVRHRVESTGGRVVFVQLTALEKALEERVGAQEAPFHFVDGVEAAVAEIFECEAALVLGERWRSGSRSASGTFHAEFDAPAADGRVRPVVWRAVSRPQEGHQRPRGVRLAFAKVLMHILRNLDGHHRGQDIRSELIEGPVRDYVRAAAVDVGGVTGRRARASRTR